MKKYILLLPAFIGALAFASCGEQTTSTDKATGSTDTAVLIDNNSVPASGISTDSGATRGTSNDTPHH